MSGVRFSWSFFICALACQTMDCVRDCYCKVTLDLLYKGLKTGNSVLRYLADMILFKRELASRDFLYKNSKAFFSF